MRAIKEGKGPVSLNMVPIMNLFLAMIPFLLMSAAFFQVSVINASSPGLENEIPQGPPPARDVSRVTLKLKITGSGFDLAADGDQSAEELEKIGGIIPKKDGDYDYEKLTRRVESIRDKYAKSDTVVIVPDRGVVYDSIVKTMDATRERIVDKRLDRRKYLFTNAVVSSLR